MIITVCPSKVHNGVWRHLTELKQFGTIHYSVSDVIDPSGVKLAIFGGCWNNDYARLNSQLKQAGAKTGLLFCSPFGQASLSNEVQYLNIAWELLRCGKIDYLFVGTEEMEKVFNDERVIYLPQTLDYKSFLEKYKRSDIIPLPNTVGLFCSKAYHKNIVNQLMAVKGMGYILHTNALDDENKKLALYHNIPYTNYDWMSEEDYYYLLQKTKIHMQCSCSEAFDYVVAETMLLGRPCLVSPSISWVWNPNMKVPNIDSPECIREYIRNYETLIVKETDLQNDVITELEKRNSIIEKIFKRLV
jgi:hypothetical protein